MVNGEEVVHDPYEITATQSLYLSYVYLLVPAAYVGTLIESAEYSVSVRAAQPAVIANKALLSDEQKEQGIIVCDIGAEYTNLTIYQHGTMTGVRVLPFGGNTITNEIALLKKKSREEAEQDKTGMHNDNTSLKKQDIQRIEKKITATLKATLLAYIKELDPKKDFPGGIMLLGQGAQYPRIEEILEKVTGLYTFHAKTPYHIQSQYNTHQQAWYTAYTMLYSIAAQQETNLPRSKKNPLLPKNHRVPAHNNQNTEITPPRNRLFHRNHHSKQPSNAPTSGTKIKDKPLQNKPKSPLFDVYSPHSV